MARQSGRMHAQTRTQTRMHAQTCMHAQASAQATCITLAHIDWNGKRKLLCVLARMCMCMWPYSVDTPWVKLCRTVTFQPPPGGQRRQEGHAGHQGAPNLRAAPPPPKRHLPTESFFDCIHSTPVKILDVMPREA